MWGILMTCVFSLCISHPLAFPAVSLSLVLVLAGLLPQLALLLLLLLPPLPPLPAVGRFVFGLVSTELTPLLSQPLGSW